MSVHIQHFGSESSRILGSRHFAQRESLSLSSGDLTRTRIEARRVSCDPDPFLYTVKLCPYCQSVEPTSTQLPTLFPQHRRRVLRMHRIREHIPTLPLCRLQVMIVQPPSCATLADVDLRSTFVSRPLTVDHHLQQVDIFPGFQLQCPIASAHEISADAISSGRTLHSSGIIRLTQN